MTQPEILDDKWGGKAMNPTVEFFHSAVRKLVAERFAASGKSWEEAVEDPSLELTREDFADIESQMLATGYRFEASAQVSTVEEPDKYKPEVGVGDSGQQATRRAGSTGRRLGDNVFRAKSDLTGTARLDQHRRHRHGHARSTASRTAPSPSSTTPAARSPRRSSRVSPASSAWAARSAPTSASSPVSTASRASWRPSSTGCRTATRSSSSTPSHAADAYAERRRGSPCPHHQGRLRGRARCPPAQLRRAARDTTPGSASPATSSTSSARPAPCRSRSSSRSTPTSRCPTSTPGTASPSCCARSTPPCRPRRSATAPARSRPHANIDHATGIIEQFYLGGRADPHGHGDAQAHRRPRRRHVASSTSRRRLNLALPPQPRAHPANNDAGTGASCCPSARCRSSRPTRSACSPGDKLHTAVVAASSPAVSQYALPQDTASAAWASTTAGPTRSRSGEMLVRDFVDLAEGDYPWLDGVAAGVELNNLTLPVIMKDTHFNIVDDWAQLRGPAQLRPRQHARRRPVHLRLPLRRATSRCTWTTPPSWPTTSTTCATRSRGHLASCGRRWPAGPATR